MPMSTKPSETAHFQPLPRPSPSPAACDAVTATQFRSAAGQQSIARLRDGLLRLRTHAATAIILGSMAAGATAGLEIPGIEIIVEPDNPVSSNGTTTSFGRAVALDRDVLVVSAPLDDVDAGIGHQRGAVYVFQRIGGVWTPQAKLVAPDGEDDDEFGHAVDVALGPPGLDDFVIVGAPKARRLDAGPDGKVYVFRRDDDCAWVFDTQLFPNPDTEEPSSEFGYDVAIDVSVPANSQTGDPAFTAVAGSPRAESPTATGDNHGAIHIYQLVGSPQGWQLTHEFFGHDPQSSQSGMMLGTSVALDGGLLVSGARLFAASAYQSGAGFLFGRGNQLPAGHFNWSEGSRLEATTAEQMDQLGLSAAVSFDTSVALLGAPFHDGLGFASSSGAVYVFELFSFGLARNEVQLLKPFDDAPGNQFGAAVDIDGRHAVIGSPGADVGNLDGAIYLFEQTSNAFDSWVQIGKLSPSDMQSSFTDVGAAAAISESVSVYGATQRVGVPNAPEGAVYVNELGPLFANGFENVNAPRCSATGP